MTNRILAAAALAGLLGFAAQAGAQPIGPGGVPLGQPSTAGGERGTTSVRPGANSVLTPNAAAPGPATTQNTQGATPTDDSNSSSASGGPGTGPVPGTNTNR